MASKTYLSHFTLMLVSLLTYRFFGLFSGGGILILGFFLLSSYKEAKRPSRFRWLILLMMMFAIFNCYTTQIFRHQSFFTTLPQLSHYLMLVCYFFYIKKNITIQALEKLLFGLTITFIICYLFQYIIYPTPLFIGNQEYGDDIRIRLYGQNICTLGYFFCLNKYLLYRNRKHLLVAILALFVVLLWGFRTILIASIAFSFLMYWRIKGFAKLATTIPLLVVLVVIIAQVPIVSDKIDAMMERFQTGQNFKNEDYIRNLLIAYFMNEHFQSNWEMFLGSGLPAGKSAYANLITALGERGFHWNDMGLWGLSWMLGIPTTLLMIGYGVKAAFTKVPKPFYYATYWFLFLILIGFTTAEYIRIGNYIAQGLALAIIHKVYINTNIHAQNRDSHLPRHD